MTNSQPKPSVATIERATEILTANGSTHIEHSTGRCECGETISVQGFTDNYEYIGYVLACDYCGDDDAFIDEVFNT